jgi:hypothetical protein
VNVSVLKYIIENIPEKIENYAQEASYDPSITLGVAKRIIRNDGNIFLLSDKQKFHYENFLKPLLEDVQCEGVFGKDTCTGNGLIDDESLLISYMDDEFLCQLCRHDRDKNRE